MDQPWHSGDKLLKDLLQFHQACASFPKSQLAEAKTHFLATADTLRDALQKNGVSDFQYTGSTYEGIKVPSTDAEFDVMVILNGGNNIKVEDPGRLYSNLSSDSTQFSRVNVPDSKHIDPNKVLEQHFGVLQREINQCPDLQESITLRRHGPAVQMDIYQDSDKKSLFYSVDMVPTYFVPDRGFYVAKPFRDEQFDGGQTSMAWRKSFSLQEKRCLNIIDQGNKCHKQCIRILKVLRDTEPGLHHLNSYFIKTSILNLSRDQPDLDWRQKNLGKCLTGSLKYLHGSLEEGKLGHPYVCGFNMLSGMSPKHKENMTCRVKQLLRSEKTFSKALTTAKRQGSSPKK